MKKSLTIGMGPRKSYPPYVITDSSFIFDFFYFRKEVSPYLHLQKSNSEYHGISMFTYVSGLRWVLIPKFLL